MVLLVIAVGMCAAMSTQAQLSLNLSTDEVFNKIEPNMFPIESLSAVSDTGGPTANPYRAYNVELVADGAVIADQSTGNSANPSVIRVPDWIPAEQRANKNANYYMYYGNHSGHHIQMKWAETPEGPWINFNLGGTYNGHTRLGVFDVDSDSTREDYDHVFSPDVHVDNANHQIVMYYHGENQPSTKTLTTGQDVPRQHANFVATSHWGLNFNDPAEAGGESGYGPVTVTFDGITRDVCLGEDYQHVFKYKGNYYSLSKRAMMMMAANIFSAPTTRPRMAETSKLPKVKLPPSGSFRYMRPMQNGLRNIFLKSIPAMRQTAIWTGSTFVA